MIVEKTPITPIIGIYKITSPSGRIYVGQSCNIKGRFRQYERLTNCKEQPFLYNSLIKYGYHNHISETIEVFEAYNQAELDKREIFYIKLFNCFNSKKGLNLKDGGANGKASEETKKKMSEAHKKRFQIHPSKLIGTKLTDQHKLNISIAGKGRIVSKETKQRQSASLKNRVFSQNHRDNISTSKKGQTNTKSRIIIQISFDTECEIARFNSSNIAGTSLGIKDSTIISVCKRRFLSAGNFFWMYADDVFDKKWFDECKVRRHISRKYIQVSFDGIELKTWDSIVEAAKELGISEVSISGVCRGKNVCTGGFFWRYSDKAPFSEKELSEFRRRMKPVRRGKIAQLSLSGELIKIWNSSADAARGVGASKSNLSLACKYSKYRKICKGFNWGYASETGILIQPTT